jgi:DNA-binding transcriptional MerR regulator
VPISRTGESAVRAAQRGKREARPSLDWNVERSKFRAVDLLKIGELARRSGVTVATLKHYLREGLIRPARKTGRTMSWYEPGLVARVQAIKELQRRRFLPLDVIKRAIASDRNASDDHAAATAIAAVLAKHGGTRTRTRAELVDQHGADPRELDWLAAAGLAVPTGPEQRYRGDDLALLSTLGDARRVGISPAMLPFAILNDYLAALRGLVEVELRMFRAGVLARADRDDVDGLTTAATELSERLVVLLRRKLLLPALHAMTEDDRRDPSNARHARARRMSARSTKPTANRRRVRSARRPSAG